MLAVSQQITPVKALMDKMGIVMDVIDVLLGNGQQTIHVQVAQQLQPVP
jgi:hypothetical protein